jgi:protoporphyrinogen/coproporphyrinogen III oxidase
MCIVAYRLHITLLEKESRTGGWIRTDNEDGFMIERGPRSLRASGENSMPLLKLAYDLNLRPRTVTASRAAGKRFIYLDENKETGTSAGLHQLGGSLVDIATSPLTGPMAIPVLKEMWQPRAAQNDETVHEFFTRRLGTHAADFLADPFIAGIFGGDARTLSLRSCLPLAHRLEQMYGSLILGGFKYSNAVKRARDLPWTHDDVRHLFDPFIVSERRMEEEDSVLHDEAKEQPEVHEAWQSYAKEMKTKGIISFRDGMQSLTDQITAALDVPDWHVVGGRKTWYDRESSLSGFISIDTQVNASIERFTRSANGKCSAVISGDSLECDHVFSTLSGPALANILEASPSFMGSTFDGKNSTETTDEVMRLINSVSYASMYAVALCYADPNLIPEAQNGFGFLCPSHTQPRILGTTFDHVPFPEQTGRKGSRFTVMMGGGRDPSITALDSDAVSSLALEQFQNCMRPHVDLSKKDPLVISPYLASSAIPQYSVGHTERMLQLQNIVKSSYPSLSILGPLIRDVGVPDCIARAKHTAQMFVEQTLQVEHGT